MRLCKCIHVCMEILSVLSFYYLNNLNIILCIKVIEHTDFFNICIQLLVLYMLLSHKNRPKMCDNKNKETAYKEADLEPAKKFEDVLEEIGGFGVLQKAVFVLTCYPYLLSGFFMLNPVFILGVPEHRCAIPGYDNDTYRIQNENHRRLVNLTIPLSDVEGREYDRCFIYESETLDTERSSFTNVTKNKVVCHKWVYDKSVYENTFVAQVDLVCDKEIWVANAEMIFYGGMLVGSLASGILADRYGRKPVMYISLLVMTGASIGLSWVTEYWLFCTVEFIIGAAIIAGFMPGYVISIEITSCKKRFWPGIVSNYPYVIGLLILTGIAYWTRDWFYIELYTSVPGVIMIVYYWLIPESPRWLLSKGRIQEAEAVIRKAAKWNKVVLPEGALFDQNGLEEEQNTASILQLFTHKTLCVRTLLIFFNWMVVSLAYFGLALNSGNLSVDLYLNFGLSGLVEFPAYLIVTYLVERFGRRLPYTISMIIGGISCISTVLSIKFVQKGSEIITLLLALSGRLCATAAFAIVYIHSVELFPTVVRNAGMGGCSLFARVGTMIAPYIVTLGETIGGTIGEALPLLVFGCMSLISGITSLMLPETLNRNLPETIEDGETFGKNGGKRRAIVMELEDIKTPLAMGLEDI